MDNLNNLEAALAILSAMLTPAVLISACGALTISTSNRLGRTLDQTRKISEQLESLVSHPLLDSMLREERTALLFDQLHRTADRTRLLHRALTAVYLALSVFVFTSIAIGIVSVSNEKYGWLPIFFGLVGASLLFYACGLLIVETRLARNTIYSEMNFIVRLSELLAPKPLIERQNLRKRWYRSWMEKIPLLHR